MVIHVEHPWLILAKKTFSLECYIKEHKNMSIIVLVKGKASLKVAYQRQYFSFHCLATLPALLSSTERASPSYLRQGHLLLCPSAYPSYVFLLLLPSSRHQIEVACSICHRTSPDVADPADPAPTSPYGMERDTPKDQDTFHTNPTHISALLKSTYYIEKQTRSTGWEYFQLHSFAGGRIPGEDDLSTK